MSPLEEKFVIDDNKMNYIDKFLEYEEKNHLLNECYKGFHYWGYIRFFVYSKITKELENLSETSQVMNTYGMTQKIKRAYHLIYNSIFHNPFLRKGQCELFILNHERRMKINDFYEATYIDELLRKYSRDYVVLEPLSQAKDHYKPIKTHNVVYQDYIVLYTMIMKKFKKKSCLELEKKLHSIIEDLNRIYDIKLDQKNIIDHCFNLMNIHNVRIDLYRKLLLKLKPKCILEVVYYNMNQLIVNEVAKELKIPIIELQHGTMGMYHISYNFAKKQKLSYFPDKILLFSEYWKKQTRFPIEENNLIVTGFPFMERMVTETTSIEKTNKDATTILFISQTTIGEKLSKFAVQLYELLSNQEGEYKIMYKFHPAESNHWEEKFPWLAEYQDKIDVISENTKSIYDYFAISDIQVGVYSTALFEGLAYGLETYVVKYYGYQFMEDVCKNNYATLIEKAEDLLITHKQQHQETKSLPFWEDDSVNKIIYELEKTMNSEITS